jgi:hypothetical protein
MQDGYAGMKVINLHKLVKSLIILPCHVVSATYTWHQRAAGDREVRMERQPE